MREVERSVVIDAPIAQVWAFFDEPRNARSYIAGLRRHEHVSGPRIGLGSVYRTHVTAGPLSAHNHLRVVAYEPPHRVAFTSTAGMHQEGEWRLDEVGDRSRVSLRLRFTFRLRDGGPAGEAIAAAIANVTVQRTLDALRDLMESRRPDPR